MALSDAFLQELKFRCDIESVVSKYVNLKRRGRSLVGLCPFHSEKTPSFTVFPENQNFYCFGCGAGGDVITFIRKIENLDYIDSVKQLAQMAGIEMPDERPDDGSAAIRTRVLEMNREAARFFHDTLKSPAGAKGLEYFKKRRLSNSTITSFGLGYAPDSWDSLLKHLKALGYTEEEMSAANLIAKGRSGNYYDQFRNRVMFPIIDVRGGVIAFGGRVLDDSKPKYLNSSDTPVFKKSRCLFALNFAKNGNNNTVILCEGYMDVIAMHQAGFTNAVATLGTALTPEQARVMARYAKEVIVSYDSDNAGQMAAKRAIGLLTEAGLSVKILKIEGGKDPDEYIKNYGADRFRNMLSKSSGHVEYRLGQAKEKYDLENVEQKVAYLKEAAGILATVESPIEREVYAGQIAQELSVSKDSVLREAEALDKKRKKGRVRTKLRTELMQTQGAADRINPEKSRHLRAAVAEETLLCLLLKNPDFLKQADKMITPDDFVTSFNKRVYEAVRLQILTTGEADLSALGESFSPEEIGRITSLLVKKQVSNTLKETTDCVHVIKMEAEKIKEENSTETEIEDVFEKIKKMKMEEKKKTGGSY